MQPGLYRHSHSGVGSAKARVAIPPFDNLEEEPVLEGVGVGMPKFAECVPVVKQAQSFQLRRGGGVQAKSGRTSS